jgi:DNA repair exonuclease SbcCD nuclease subunit
MGPRALQEAVSEAITQIIFGFSAVETEDIPRVLLYHGTVRGAQATESQHMMGLDIELTPGDIERCKFDLVCAGHLHYSQQIGRNIFYPGGLCFTSYGDEGRKGAWLQTIENGRLQSDFIQVSAIPMRTFRHDLTADEAFLTPPEWANEVCDVKVQIKVREDEAYKARQGDYRALFPNARSIVTQREVVPAAAVRCETVRQARTLREKVKTYCEFAGIRCTESMLRKADMLGAVDEQTLIEGVEAASRLSINAEPAQEVPLEQRDEENRRSAESDL